MSLKHAILGLLAEGPLTGYDLKHRIDEAGVWSADQSQIYRTLATMTADGWVTRHTVVQTDRPSQHPHQLTEAGRAEFQRWLGAPPEAPGGPRDPFDLRLWFGAHLPAAVTRRALAERRAELAEVEQELVEDASPSGPGLASALRHAAQARQLAHVRTELAWLDATDDVLARFDTSRKEAAGE
ncbi:MAG: PadR family transcriptional regulator [Propionibacteriaceae bacterium]|nr:PadR family transcriptional regulator [Propionibacteriaceae bacterium]